MMSTKELMHNAIYGALLVEAAWLMTAMPSASQFVFPLFAGIVIIKSRGALFNHISLAWLGQPAGLPLNQGGSRPCCKPGIFGFS